MFNTLICLIDSINRVIFNTVSWFVALMVVVMFGIVTLRYGFNIGSIAAQESITYLHGLVFMLAIAHTLKINGHVRVDIFYQRLGPKGRAIVNLLGSVFLLLPVSIFIAHASWDYVSTSWAYFEGSREAGGLDGVFLLKSLIPLMAFLLFLQGLSEIMKSICTIREANHGR